VRFPLTRIIFFGILTAGVSWTPWIVLIATGADISAGRGAVVFGLAASGPSIAAFILWLARPAERVAARTRPRASWALLAVVAGALSPAATAALLDPGQIASHASATVASVGGIMGAIGYTLISGPLSEEFGWRGYLQPRLRLIVKSPLSTAAIMGAAWGCWHLPLFFLPGTGQHDEGLLTYSGLCFLGSLFPLSFIALFLVERLRGGVLAAILLHAAWNLAGALMPPPGNAGAVLQLTMLAGIALLTGAWWYRHPGAHRNLQRPQPSETLTGPDLHVVPPGGHVKAAADDG
jgi:membrane protease YdiL (CAAX protease family)